MAVAEFPLPSVSGSNPIPLFFEELEEQFVVQKTIYDDNGADFALQAGGTGLRQWVLRYDGLTLAEAAILDNWMATTFYSPDNGSAYGFNFRAHVANTAWTNAGGTLYSNVHIAPNGYRKSHSKATICAREFLLEKRPS
jgi:hypothetical protein